MQKVVLLFPGVCGSVLFQFGDIYAYRLHLFAEISDHLPALFRHTQ